jgi:hypothetical protein
VSAFGLARIAVFLFFMPSSQVVSAQAPDSSSRDADVYISGEPRVNVRLSSLSIERDIWTLQTLKPANRAFLRDDRREVVIQEKYGALLFVSKDGPPRLLHMYVPQFASRLAAGGQIRPDLLSETALSPSGKLIAIAPIIDNHVFLINLDALEAEPDGLVNIGRRIVMHGGDGSAISGGDQIESRAVMAHLAYDGLIPGQDFFADLTFCNDGKDVVSITSRGQLVVWRIPDDLPGNRAQDASAILPSDVRAILAPTQGKQRLRGLACGGDGSLVVTGDDSGEGSIQLWDSSSIELQASITGGKPYSPEGRVDKVVFSRDGKTFLTVGEDEVQLWSAGAGKITPLGRLHLPSTRKFPIAHSAVAWGLSDFLYTNGDDVILITPQQLKARQIDSPSRELPVTPFNGAN